MRDTELRDKYIEIAGSTTSELPEKINKQTEMNHVLTTSIETKEENIKSMIIYNRIIIGVMMNVYITFEIYKNYNFESQQETCEVKHLTYV